MSVTPVNLLSIFFSAGYGLYDLSSKQTNIMINVVIVLPLATFFFPSITKGHFLCKTPNFNIIAIL